ncbi:MAG: heavy metal-binding domain-containing protein [Thermoplasmata archaeon]|nr:heavy metal-binding domain-containing protein [Thermoplasmata archaeon]
MLTVNLDHVPGREITKTLGMVIGHARVQKDGRGRRFVGTNGKKWPWTDDAQHHEMLIQEGMSRLEEAGESLQANCILGVECKISRDADNLPEVIFSGTAVIVEAREEKLEMIYHESTGEVDVSIGGKKGKWVLPPAVGDDDKDEHARGRGQIIKKQDDPARDLAKRMGTSLEVASTLIKNGFDSPEKIAESSPKELSKLVNMNPTQARLFREKAVEVVGQE